MHSSEPEHPASWVGSPNVANAAGPAPAPANDSGGRQQVRLAHPEPAVQVEADPWRRLAFPEHLAFALLALDRFRQNRRQNSTPRPGWARGVRPVVVELTSANVGGGTSWSDQPLGDTVG